MEIGLDIVEVPRIRRIIRRTPGFLERVFTAEEIAYCRGHKDPWPHYAVRFAAKEAVWKALGQAGALVTLPGLLKEYLINCARAFIYTTAPPPLTAVAVQRALEVVRDEPLRREDLLGRVDHARAKLAAVFGLIPGSTQILPLIVGEDARAVAIAQALQARGFDVRAMRAPTVAEGAARLRISITLNSSRDDIDGLAVALAHVLAELL